MRTFIQHSCNQTQLIHTPPHTKHSASRTAGLQKHLCCAVALQGRRREGACARENRGKLHHSDGKILSLASQKTFIVE